MKVIAGIVLLMLVTKTLAADAAPERTREGADIPLWENGAPGALGTAPKDIPTVTVYLPERDATGAAIVICPGGGYAHLAPHEGNDYALFLNKYGVTCFVLKYRLSTDGYHHPSMLQDASRGVRWVRANAEKYKVDPRRVGIMGSSAGGHLASTLMTHFDAGDSTASDPIDRQSSRPDYGILCYAVISMSDIAHGGSKKGLIGENPSPEMVKLLSNELQVTPQTPPAFIWHGADDKTVKVENSLRFAEACAQNKVPFELHIYEHARHGLGLGDKPPFEHALPWTKDLVRWLVSQKAVSPAATQPSK
jgi:acetyl esterase/lipase